MPGESFHGTPEPLNERDQQLRDRLREHVRTLAGAIGERNLGGYPERLRRASEYIENEFRSIGYEPREQVFEVKGAPVRNVYVRAGRSEAEGQRFVVGAHYDTVRGSPGANDNATGVAAVIELARHFHGSAPGIPIDFVAFVNEEPPYFTTDAMGSARYARRLHRRDIDVKAMIALETIGYYSEEPGSQQYPFPINFFYPSRGNFLGFVGNVWYRRTVRRAIEVFRSDAELPSRGIAAPQFVPGVGWSDHRSFWQYGYPALMVTDTALYRYPHYHQPADRPREIDYENLTRAVRGLKPVIETMAAE